jgi:hypothetical protein
LPYLTLAHIIVSFHILSSSPFSPWQLKARNYKCHYTINQTRKRLWLKRPTVGWKILYLPLCLTLAEFSHVYLTMKNCRLWVHNNTMEGLRIRQDAVLISYVPTQLYATINYVLK